MSNTPPKEFAAERWIKARMMARECFIKSVTSSLEEDKKDNALTTLNKFAATHSNDLENGSLAYWHTINEAINLINRHKSPTLKQSSPTTSIGSSSSNSNVSSQGSGVSTGSGSAATSRRGHAPGRGNKEQRNLRPFPLLKQQGGLLDVSNLSPAGGSHTSKLSSSNRHSSTTSRGGRE